MREYANKNKKPQIYLQEKKVMLGKILSQKNTRIKYCERDFEAFFCYYFFGDIKYKQFADFHKERFLAISKRKRKIFAKGMRGIAKTTILAIANEVRRICYNKNKFICNLCYDLKKSKSLNALIMNELVTNKKIKEDFGQLFPFTITKAEKQETGYQSKGVSEFVTATGTKVKAFGMGTTMRGEVHKHATFGMVRPDFLVIDDIDNNENTKNKRLIKDDMDFLESEVFGGLEQGGFEVVRLGNVIRQDGRNVRMERKAKNDNSWIVFDNFLFGEAGKTNGDICRGRYVHDYSEETLNEYGQTISIQRLKEDWGAGFAQNALGVPLKVGDTLHEKELTKYFYEYKKYDKVVIGIDPAQSLKTGTDGVGICVTGEYKEGEHKHIHILEAFALYGKEKDEDNIERVIAGLYQKYNASLVIVESNNGGHILARRLEKSYITGMSVQTTNTTKDKATRYLEIKGYFLRGQAFFHESLCRSLVQQLEEFTGEDGGDDDIVDGMINTMQERKIGYFL